ncbi:unnamed protein product [Urochloa decumbens]|uniref:Cystathionine gamma-synthase n=1 Tax=Urochloa decumbens TaxID=240449 RepID=A0ABC8WXL4_9POAL
MARSSSSHAKTFLPRQQRRHLRPRRSPKKRVDATVLCPGALQNLSGAQPEHLPPGMDLPRHAGDKTLAVHAGEKLGRCWGTDTDSIVTPVVGGATHWFKNSEDLIAFKEGRRHSHEYGRYSNPTVKVLEDKISSLEKAEATLVTSSGMNAIVVTLLALVPPGSHVVTTTDCYSEARAFVRDRLGKMGIKSTFIDLDDMEKLKAVLETNDVSLFYADSPTNPFLKCLDISVVVELCHHLSGAQPEHAAAKTLAVHAGEKLGRCWGTDTDSIGTPVVGGTTHWFKNSEDLIAFKEGRRHSHEYGRYSNPTVKVLEDKISSLERAEATLVISSGMNAIVVTLLALVPPGSHVVTTTDCYSEARAFVRDRLGKMGIKSTFIDLDDMEKLKAVLETNDVSLFYADSPTNPFLKCLDISVVVELCHRRGALVCIDSTMASPINQKPLTLGANIVLHSAINSPWHQVARVQMDGYGGVISFETKSDLCGTMRFIDALEIPFIATSLGGCESLVQQPAVMSFWGQTDEEKSRNGIKDNLVRFSLGIEKFEDLRDDILQALEKI